MKRILVFLIVLLCSFSIFCTTTWTWSSPYRHTYGFRYQLNTDEADNWTYVSPDVTSLTLDDVPDGTTLYVQLSLDGETWSPSGEATYIMEKEEEVPDVPEIREASITAAEDERLNRRFEFAFDIDFGTDMYYEEGLSVSPYLGAVLDFKNIYSPCHWFGLGVRVKGGASFNPVEGKNIITAFVDGRGFADFNIGGYLDASLGLSFIVADSVDLTLSAGGGLTMLNDTVPSLFSIKDTAFGTYVVAGASLDRYFGQMFHLGLSYSFKHFFEKGTQGLNTHNVGIHMGLTF